MDLQSKNGIFFNGQRVDACNLVEGDSFRCGDITFLLEGATTQGPKISVGVQTLPSPLGLDSSFSKRVTKVPAPAVVVEDDQRYKDKLFLLIRASELLVGQMPLDRMLDELVVFAVQVLDVDRIALLVLDETTLEMKPRSSRPSSAPRRVRTASASSTGWSTTAARPSFADVSRDKTLPGNAGEDAQIKSAMAVPINPGGGTIGVLYADSVSRADVFRPDDLALFRALANIAAVATDSHHLREAKM